MVSISSAVFDLVDFKPTDLQKRILNSDKRFILVAGGEQAGKSMVASKFLLQKFLTDESPGLYWLVVLTMRELVQSLNTYQKTLPR